MDFEKNIISIDKSSSGKLLSTWQREIYKETEYSLKKISKSNFSKLIKKFKDEIIESKKEWDLGMQKSCFLGLKINKNFTGLLNNSNVKKYTDIKLQNQ